VAVNLYGTRVEFRVGILPDEPADALVLPTNDHLWMGSGSAMQVRERGGEEIEKEAIRQGPAALGQVVATGAGNLPHRIILHAVVASQDLHVRGDALGEAVAGALREAARRKLESVQLLVPQETGGRPLKPELLVNLVRVLFEVLEEVEGLRTLTLWSPDEKTSQLLHDAFLQQLR
jgi:hypothetical protein